MSQIKNKSAKQLINELRFCELSLLNGCYVSKISVSPKGWDTNPKSVNQNWVIHYRFKDPAHIDKYPHGKPVQVKGMNDISSYETRKKVTQALREDILSQLCDDHFNPITNSFGRKEPDPENDPLAKGFTSTPKTLWITAMRDSITNLEYADDTKRDMSSMMNFIEKAVHTLNYQSIPIGEVNRAKLIKVLNECGRSANRTNKFITHCSSIWRFLKVNEACKDNIVSEIPRKVEIIDETKVKETLSITQRRLIDNHLYKNCYNFWRFMQIFFHSGSREKELLRVKVKDVDLKSQQYKVLIKKRKIPTIVSKPIKNCVKHIWAEVIKNADPEAYVFGANLCPEIKEKPMWSDHITRRWREWVKNDPNGENSKGLGIDIDFYRLKHLHSTLITDHITELLMIDKAQKIAAEFNSHTSTEMVQSVYDVKNIERRDKVFKGIDISFSGL